MIENSRLLFLPFLMLGVLLAFYTGILVFKNPTSLKLSGVKASTLPRNLALIAAALMGVSAILYEFAATTPTLSFSCSFQTPYPPTTLSCIATSSDIQSMNWKVSYPGQSIPVRSGSSMNLDVTQPGVYKVTLVTESGLIFTKKREAEQDFTLQAKPAPRLTVRSLPFAIRVSSGDTSSQQITFALAPGESLVDVRLEVRSAQNATANIVAVDRNQVTIIARQRGDVKLYPFGIQQETGYVEGQLIGTISKSTSAE